MLEISKVQKLAILATAVLVFTVSFARGATDSGVTYQGRIISPDGTPLQSSTVQFKLQIRTHGSENCLMFEEIQSKDMHASSVFFQLPSTMKRVFVPIPRA